ncbi:MAG TPA: aconitase family protein, partial [Pseudolysinimonas sp.]
MSAVDSFGSKTTLTVGGTDYEVFRIDTVPGHEKLPFSLKVLLENQLRTEDGANVTKSQIQALGSWDPAAEPDTEIQFTPARVIMQDFTGVPCIVDLATMREAVGALGGDANKINPLAPAELVIDHSVIADLFGTTDSLERNVDIEYERNGERYQFLRWGQTAFDDFKVVPPGTGIVHQVNIEYLARVTFTREVPSTGSGQAATVLRAYPDTLVGTDSHTTMVNGLGVLGWGVGGIEAEAAMLGQPVSLLIPKVVGFKLSGSIPTGVTATDVVLTITQMLRKHGVVGKFVEFYGAGVAEVPLANRATIGNMSPEFGSTAAMFPIDQVTLEYLRQTGRSEDQIALVEAYSKLQKLWHDPDMEPAYSEYLELDLSTVVPSIAGPKRPQDRVELTQAKAQFEKDLVDYADSDLSYVDVAIEGTFPASDPIGFTAQDETTAHEVHHSHVSAAPKSVSRPIDITLADGTSYTLNHGAVAVAAITSCTNTSNPSVMLAAGLL